MIDFRILGPVEVHRDGQPLTLGGPRQVALLALLLVHANKWVTSDRLLDELWHDADARIPMKRVHVTVARLRKALGDGAEELLKTVPQGYLLAARPEQLDSQRFVSGVEAGRQLLAEERLEQASERLAEALALWRGPALADVVDEPFAQSEIAILDEQRLVALETRIDAELRLGRDRTLVAELEGLVATHPTRERLVEQLMLALYRSGRQTEALDVYQRAHRHLDEAFGVQPGPALQALQREVLEQAPSLIRSEPVVVVRGDAEPLRPLAHATAADASPFVGRAEELARLDEHLSAAFDGATRAVVISGEPGIGKTRLVAELMASAMERGARIFYGGGDEDGALPYQPIVEAVERYLSETAAQMRADGLEDALGELARLMPGARLSAAPRDPLGDADIQRFRLFQAVAAALDHAARDQPLLLVLDDLQWADPPTRQLLRHLLRGGTAGRRLLVCVHRDVGVAKFFRGLSREAQIDHVELGGLAPADAVALIGARLPDAPEPLVETLIRETEGNPLFLGEVLRSLGEDPGEGGFEVPDTVVEVVAQRLERLEDGTVDVLRAASVAGLEFDVAVLEEALDLPGEEVLDALDDAQTAGLVTERRDALDRFAFSHALVRRTLYDGQSRSRRSRMHLRIGTALEVLGGVSSGELGHHFWHARAVGGAERAVKYLWTAGKLADQALAWEDAARHYRAALGALEQQPEDGEATRAALLLALGDAHERSGDPAGAKRAFEEAAGLARAQHDGELLANAALGYGRAPGSATDVDRALLSLLEEALAELGDGNDTLRARVLARLAVEQSALPEAHSRADALSREAVELAEQAGEEVVLSIVLASRHWVLSGPEGLEERSRAARRGLELAMRAGDTERELAARAWWLFDLLELGDIGELEQQLAAYEALAGALRHPSYLGYAAATRAMLGLLHGDLAAAEPEIEKAEAALRRADDPDAARVATLQRFLLHLERGEPARAHQAVAKPPSARPLWDCLAAWARCEEGELDGARLVDPAEIARDEEWLTAMSALARVVVARGDEKAVRAVYDALRPFAGHVAAIEAIACVGAVAHPLGLLAAALGERETACELLEQAIALDERMGAEPWTARARADLDRIRCRTQQSRQEVRAECAELGAVR